MLRKLLTGAIDYAGLFPPAKKPVAEALHEYQNLGPQAFLVSRFVCASGKLADANQTLRDNAYRDKPLPATIVGVAVEHGHGAAESIHRDLDRMAKSDLLAPEAYEIKLPHNHGLHQALKALDRSGVFDELEDVYVELRWGPDLEEAIHETVETIEGVGLKARCGGQTPESFPHPAELSLFIHTVASLGAPFKFTAGLHHACPTPEPDLRVTQHGFLNVLAASALALSQDLSRREIEEILTLPADTFSATDDQLTLGPHTLTPDDANALWEWCGGFGSCSVTEPAASLAALNL